MARTKNQESFFSMLTNVERYVINKGYYFDQNGEEVLYSELSVETFNLLTNFIASGKYANSSSFKFIGSHFRLSVKDLTSLWNRVFKSEKVKNIATVRVQVSNASKLLYKIFGVTVYDTFINDDKEGLENIKKICNAFLIGDLSFSDLFIDEVSINIEDRQSDRTYSVDELKETLYDLKCTSRSNIDFIIKKLPKDKVLYIRDIINQPIITDGVINKTKINLLNTFYETEIKNQVLVEEVLTKTEVEKEEEPIVNESDIWNIEGLSFFETTKDFILELISDYEGDDLYSVKELAFAIAILRESCSRTYIATAQSKVSDFISKGLKNPKVILSVLNLLQTNEDFLDDFIDYCCMTDSTADEKKEVGLALGHLVDTAKLDEELKKNLVEGGM